MVFIETTCKFCYSPNVIKYGYFKNTQRWWCKDCHRKFADNGAKPNMKTHNDQVSTALGMYYEGMSLNTICRQLQEQYRLYPSASTVYEWIGKYSSEVITEINKHKPQVGDVWIMDDNFLRVRGINMWFWDVMDAKTRYVIVSCITANHAAVDASKAISLAAEKAGKIPRIIITDKLAAYGEAIEETFGSDTRHLLLKDVPGHADNLIRQFHEVLKIRKKVLCGLKKPQNLDLIAEGWLAHYNVFRLHKDLQNHTPSELAGIDACFDKNWYTTIQHVRKVIDDWRQSVPTSIDIGTPIIQSAEKETSLAATNY